MYKLKIDTSDNKIITVELFKNDKLIEKINSDPTLFRSENTIPLINKILINNNLEVKALSLVEVNRGPGSFTGLRVGIAIANALSYLLNIPLNGGKIGEKVLPIYNQYI